MREGDCRLSKCNTENVSPPKRAVKFRLRIGIFIWEINSLRMRQQHLFQFSYFLKSLLTLSYLISNDVRRRSKNIFLKGAFRGKKTGHRRTASFAYKTNIHIIINISRYFSTLNKGQTGHKRQTENSDITSHLIPRQIPRIVVKADHFSWS